MLKKERVALKKVNSCIFTIFGIMTKIKNVYDHDLPRSRGFCLRATFCYKNVLTILKFNFFVFYDDS